MSVETVQRGNLATDEIEALEASRTVADLWRVASARPCVAVVFLEGASSQRQPYAHLLAVEMESLGLPVENVGSLLRDWNTRVFPPLRVSEIEKVTRRLTRPGTWPYSCKHPMLQVYCIGEECPHIKNRGGVWRVSANGLTESGWLCILSSAECKVWLGLYNLARLKGRGPNHSIPFCFRELEKACGVNRHHHRAILERLKARGLLAELNIHPGEAGNRGHSSFRFPSRLPPPIQ